MTKPNNRTRYGGSGRKTPAIANQHEGDFLKVQARDRWPTEATKDKAYSLMKEKVRRGPKKKRPSPLGFPLLETLAFHTNPNTVNNAARLLIAASLKIKRVKRHPGFILIKTYNLKDRVLEIM